MEEQILDVIQIDPKIKHKTIVDTFEALKEGESFILHVNHDPKPLYYQLMSTRGEIFTWDYLKQGPDIFDIRIAKKMLDGKEKQGQQQDNQHIFADHIEFEENTPETIRTIVAFDYRKIAAFKKYNLDYAWKANITLKEACEKAKVNENELRNELEKLEKDYSKIIPSEDYYHWDMAFLANYILQTHHRYVRQNAERLSRLAENTAKNNGDKNPVLNEIAQHVRPMIDDFMTHMSKEEQVLFPAIQYMLNSMEKMEIKPANGGGISNAIEKMEAEHDETKSELERIRQITNNYELNQNTSEDEKRLYQQLQLFENDCYKHVHLENNILFPKTIILEKLITKRYN